MRYTGTIIRVGDREIDLLDPRGPFDFEDIARVLGRTCRYGNRTSRHYSVAEHSERVAFWVYFIGSKQDPLTEEERRQLTLAALLHDAHEAIVGDIALPVKNAIFEMGVEYHYSGITDAYSRRVEPDVNPVEELERGVQRAIFEQVGLDPALADDPLIVEADARIPVDEMNLLFPGGYPGDKEPLGVAIKCLSPEEAAREWLDRVVEFAP